MFELDGIEYSREKLEEEAKRQGIDFDSFMRIMKNRGMVEKSSGAKVSMDINPYQKDTAQYNIWNDQLERSEEDNLVYIADPSVAGSGRWVPREQANEAIESTNKSILTQKTLLQPELETRGWFEQALDAGTINADLYDDADKIFDIGSAEDARKLSDQEIQAYIDLIGKSKTSAEQMEDLNRFTASFTKHNNNGENWLISTISAINDNGGVTGGGLKGFAQSTIQSYRSMLNKQLAKEAIAPTVVGVGGGFLAGGVGAIPGGMAAFFGSMNYGLETIHTFNELLEEEIRNANMEFTPDAIREIMSNDEIRAKIKAKARTRGLTIGTVEGITNLIGVKGSAAILKAGEGVTTTVGRAGIKAAAGTTAFTAEAVGGGGGEYLGGKFIGKDVSGVDIVLEGLSMGIVKAPLDVTVAAYDVARNSPNYKIDGKKVSKQSILDYVNGARTAEEIGSLNVEINNDPVFARAIQEKITNVQLESQVDAKIDDVNDRLRMVELEKQRQKEKANSEKKDIKIDPGAKERLEAIEEEMNEIAGKYTAVDGRTRDVKARAAKGKGVREARKKILMEKIKSGVESSKLYKEMDISTEQVDSETAYDLFLKQEENNAMFDIGLLQEELANVKTKKERDQIQAEIEAIEKGVEEIRQGKSEIKNTHGFLLEDSETGKLKIVINENKAIADKGGNINVAAHEFLHAVLRKTFNAKGDNFAVRSPKGVGGVVGGSLFQYLKGLDPDIATNSFMGRLLSYSKQGEEVMGQEVLNLLSDALVDGSFKPKQSTLSSLGDYFIDIFESLGTGKLKWKNPKDVYRFIKNFNKSVKGDKRAARIVKRAEKGIEIITKPAKDITVDKAKTPMSKEASDNVQRIYNKMGKEGAYEIIDAFKPIVNKIVERRREAPGFDRELLTSEIEIGRRGILDLIQEYNPNSGVPLAAYINTYLPARAIEASRRVLGEEFTVDVSERVDIAAEEVAPKAVAKPKKKKIVLADRLGITDKVSKAISKIVPKLDIDKLTFKTLKNKIPNITGELFGISPKKILSGANITKGELQSSQMFINKNADLLITMLPEGATASGTATGVPNTLLKAFYTKTDRAKMAKTGSKAGLAVQQKNNIKKTDFLETFGIIDGKPVRTDRNTSARVLALANLTGKMITNQAVRSELAKTKANDKVINKIAEGKSSVMFSQDAKDFNIDGTIDNLLDVHVAKVGRKTFKLRTEEDVDLYIEALMNDVLPLMPRAFWFGKEEGISDTGSEFTPSDRVIDIPKSRKQERKDLYVYYKQQINALNQLPDEYFGADIGIKDFSRPNYKSLFEGKKGIQVDKIIETNKRMAKIHKVLWSRIYEAIQKNPSKAATIGNYFKLVSKQNNHWHRAAAEIIGYSKNPKGTDKKLYEYEHAMPASASYLYLIDGALNGYNFESIYNPVMDNFKLIALDAAENKKLNDAGLADRMPEGWNTTDNKWWERYFNSLVDIDPNSIVTLDNKTFKENFNIVQFKSNLKNSIKLNKAVIKSRTMASKPSKGISVLDFDDTLATTESLVKYTTPDGKTGTLNAEQYASTYEDLLDQNYKFDFSDFNKVVKGKIAPLFQKALKLQKKFGPENMFVLTARPPQAAKAIFDFLKANGLNIPLKNITGLANSTSEAKALWIADKVGEGFNDFYFADDALQNVQAVANMLDQFDVKSKVQQAKVKFSKDMNENFNDILEEVTGIESKKRFSDIKARKRGSSKGKFRFFIPPSHEDFVGLLYNFMGKGKKGDKHRDFFEQALVKPLNRAYREIDTAKQAIANDYKSLNKQFSNIKKKLKKKTPDGDFTYQDAIRVYLWDKHGYDIPGLTPTDQQSLVDIVKKDSELQTYAESINTISKQEKYVDPGKGWEGGNIKIDLIDATGRVGRADYFAEFNENAEIIFSEENLNKIEAGYGKGVRNALEDMLYRIKTGVNRPKGQSGTINKFMNYLNGSVGAVMFFNMRSAILQQMSIVNYINFADNNVFAAAKAFANQPQYWKDWAFIFNSDMLKQRRGGIGTDINGAELAEAVSRSKNPTRAAIGYLLQLGFKPTQIGDNIAIATGGATFYRNRINKYIKQGMSQKEAEAAAFTDFQDITQSTQQSSRPDMTSQQQSMWIGKMVLNFQNITSQYNRLIKKAASDIYNRRISPPYTSRTQSNIGNMSRILYYGAIQNLVFYSLQTALFAVMFGDEDEENEKFLKKKERVINGTFDSILRGSGIYGVAVSTLKNMAIKWHEQRGKGYNKDESAVLMELLNFSPVVGIKARKIVNAEKTINYNENVISEMEAVDADNPGWSAVTNYIEALTNFPSNRLYQKSINIRNALDNDYEAWQRILFFSGYTTWSLGLGDTQKMIEIKEEIKKKKEKEKKKNKKKKKPKIKTLKKRRLKPLKL